MIIYTHYNLHYDPNVSPIGDTELLWYDHRELQPGLEGVKLLPLSRRDENKIIKHFGEGVCVRGPFHIMHIRPDGVNYFYNFNIDKKDLTIRKLKYSLPGINVWKE